MDSYDRHRATQAGTAGEADGREPLTKDLIATVGLRIAGDEGFPQLTMRRLADEIGVTVRALYNVVADRREVVDLVVARMVERLPVHEYDPTTGRGVRHAYRDARVAYRSFPRATLVSLDETFTPAEVPVKRMLEPERQLLLRRPRAVVGGCADGAR